MADNTITVKAQLIDEMSKNLVQINQKMDKIGKTSKTLSTGLATVAKAAGGLFVFSKIAGFMGKASKAADVQAKAEAQLATSLGYTSKALVDQAAALQKVTLYGDEQTISAQALIGAFVKEEDQIKQIIPLVQQFLHL